MKVVWTQRARRQLHRIQRYVEKRSPSGAKRIWLRIVERVANQADMPLAAPVQHGGPARLLVVTSTPYLVTYTLVGDEMRVLTVVHSARSQLAD